MKSKLWKIKNNDFNGGIGEKKEAETLAELVLSSRCETLKQVQEIKSDNLQLFDPYLFSMMKEAVRRIRIAIEAEELICIYGDYDCDGVTATAIIYNYLQNVGARIVYYIPHREKEGYGLNKTAIDALSQMGVSLIITVDNGITAIEEIEYAGLLEIDTIVTDHHVPREILPKAVAIINPHVDGCGYPFADLCGAGVAFKLVCALEGDLGYELVEQYGDLLAIATIGDIVNLKSENRFFVKKGLELLKNPQREGIRALFEVAGVEIGKDVSSQTVAFSLCPRINAAGRMDTADYAVMLILSENESEAAELSQKLNELNIERKKDEKQIVDDIAKKLKHNPALFDNRIIVIAEESWNTGVVGIVASRITERLSKPTLLIGSDGKNAKGSGRSVEGFSLIEAITKCSDVLDYYGGHPMAAGFSLKSENINKFSELLQQYEKEHPVPLVYLNIDAFAKPEMLTVRNIKQLDTLEPFGTGNPSPLFAMERVKIIKSVSLSGGKHTKFIIKKDEFKFFLLCFNFPFSQSEFSEGEMVDVAFSISINSWHGKNEPSLQCVSIKKSGVDYEAIEKDILLYRNCKIYDDYTSCCCPLREESILVYKFIKAGMLKEQTITHDYIVFSKEVKLSYLKFLISIDILIELKTVRIHPNGCFEIIRGAAKTDFNFSQTVRRLSVKNG